MNGLEYMNKICPTTSRGKDPNREDVADAFDDGIAYGYKDAIDKACEWLKCNFNMPDDFESHFKKAMEE